MQAYKVENIFTLTQMGESTRALSMQRRRPMMDKVEGRRIVRKDCEQGAMLYL